MEFEDGSRAILTLLGHQDSGRLHVLVANLHVARQAAVEHTAHERVEANAEAQQDAKALEEEKARAEVQLTTLVASHVQAIDDLGGEPCSSN